MIKNRQDSPLNDDLFGKREKRILSHLRLMLKNVVFIYYRINIEINKEYLFVTDFS